jgi:hypothetical protein
MDRFLEVINNKEENKRTEGKWSEQRKNQKEEDIRAWKIVRSWKTVFF